MRDPITAGRQRYLKTHTNICKTILLAILGLLGFLCFPRTLPFASSGRQSPSTYAFTSLAQRMFLRYTLRYMGRFASTE